MYIQLYCTACPNVHLAILSVFSEKTAQDLHRNIALDCQATSDKKASGPTATVWSSSHQGCATKWYRPCHVFLGLENYFPLQMADS